MTYGFRVTTSLIMSYKQGDNRSRHEKTELTLEFTEGLEKDAYMNDNGGLTRAGTTAVVNTLIQGLVQCIAGAEKHGVCSREEILEMIETELGRTIKTVVIG